jgi:predicted SnoaL-like aldol condensation-catalyzing enzyme
MTPKEIAQLFLMLCANGQSRQAFNLYAGKDFKHHNAFFKGDAESLMMAMEVEAQRNPTKIFEIQRALEEGDLVAVLSRVRQNSKDLGAAVVHIFRFDDNKIVELWDVGQAVPDDMSNENGMF